MSEEEGKEEESREEHATFSRRECTCNCDEEEHGWGSCYNTLPDGSECPCKAGWEE